MKITYQDHQFPYESGLDALVNSLDREKGLYMASDTDYPGRYSRWDIGFDRPPVEIRGYQDKTVFAALTPRGQRVLDLLESFFERHQDEAFKPIRHDDTLLECKLIPTDKIFTEEDRSRQPSPLSPLRLFIQHAETSDSFAGFYGAFAYDLLFCFNPIPLKQERDASHVLFHLYLPDCIYLLDRRKETLIRRRYDFADAGMTTTDLPHAADPVASKAASDAVPMPAATPDISSNMTDETYADMVSRAKEHIRKGDVFEVVLSRVFEAPCTTKPSTLFRNIRRINPSPYEFLMQMGTEQLIGASPEMFVRVEGKRVESCPISGTARRSKTPGDAAIIEDAEILRGLLNSQKDAAELTMCTDVDRNDKARICKPGSIRLLARRQIETYAGLFHTVDHVEGTLRDDFDGIDAFLSHMWAVTLTGAPKNEAAKIVEQFEPEPRLFYGAAVGALHLNGDVNTGITIRTLHLKNDIARYQSGASIVYDSVPADEAAETHTKATSFKRILSGDVAPHTARPVKQTGAGKTVILIDNEDSFVHTLADYIRQTGAKAITYRHGTDMAVLLAHKPQLIVHSPGPGLPAQFNVPQTVKALTDTGIPQFGVCLGLQGIFEAFGGTLGYLETPRHGKTWTLTHDTHPLFENVEAPAQVGAYHSIYGTQDTLPKDLSVIARNENDVIMAVAHKTLPIWAVQFHPESILSMHGYAGHTMIENVMQHLAAPA